MSRSLVRSEDVRKAWRLVGELHEIHERDEQKAHLARGLVEILNAQVCAVVPTADDSGEHLTNFDAVVDTGWATESDRRRVWGTFTSVAKARPPDYDPALNRVIQKSMRSIGSVIVRRREDVVDDHTWYRHPMVGDVFRACRLDHSIYTNLLLPNADPNASGPPRGVGMGIKRPWGDPPFDEEARNLVELIAEEVGWLGLPERRKPEGSLSPRQQETLRYLLDGASLKEIAHHLGLSRYTVDDYVKAIYRAFGVRSRGELLSRYIRRPSGTRLSRAYGR